MKTTKRAVPVASGVIRSDGVGSTPAGITNACNWLAIDTGWPWIAPPVPICAPSG
ncbi:MAG: hypothetical protein IPK27_14780 [Rhodanobacteraceae bacterium]|nr:hypothetical protein [Rhodanobacteraceae bacterium]